MHAALSCGVLVIAATGELLLCHATGTRYWDIPKGGGEPGEAPVAVAMRETREECGLELDAATLLDLGSFRYRPAKDLHLFAALTARLDARSCRCTSMFTDAKGVTKPEMDGYRWVQFDAVGRWCAGSMTAVLTQRIVLGEVHAALLAR